MFDGYFGLVGACGSFGLLGPFGSGGAFGSAYISIHLLFFGDYALDNTNIVSGLSLVGDNPSDHAYVQTLQNSSPVKMRKSCSVIS